MTSEERIYGIDQTIEKLKAEREMLGGYGMAGVQGNMQMPSPLGATGDGQSMQYANSLKSDTQIIEELFTFHPATEEQRINYERVRDAAKFMALQIWKACPYGSDRTAAIRKLRECVMTANAAIALNGLSL